ncbi:hypothetical protein Dda3937_00512 [Dickeya dadantii 3937]|uniref:Uncharacterized protein n=1 Tax=Dickeya dadantii (strain 3937) TaxID=198628 RepID=E0SBL2_DICD3|nr:hypothetical protein Dda3937_00512 [Dickeya dadantii 3937]
MSLREMACWSRGTTVIACGGLSALAGSFSRFSTLRQKLATRVKIIHLDNHWKINGTTKNSG